jgi:hypothetical protein
MFSTDVIQPVPSQGLSTQTECEQFSPFPRREVERERKLADFVFGPLANGFKDVVDSLAYTRRRSRWHGPEIGFSGEMTRSLKVSAPGSCLSHWVGPGVSPFFGRPYDRCGDTGGN